MGEEVRGLSEAPAVAGEGGVGRYLAGQRRLRGISIDELAALTKIPRRSLERLESGAFDAEADGFVRGFVRAVSGALGLDPDEAVMRLMHEPGGDEPGARRPWAVGRGQLARVAAAVALLLGVVALARVAVSWLAPLPESPTPGAVLRRDPVRELAREVAPPPEPPAPAP